MSKEIWKPVPEYDGYEVSNLGNVRSYRRKGGGELHKAPHALKPAVAGHSPYRFVAIMGKDNLRHVLIVGALILTAFVGQRPSKHCMCHKDDNPINDTLDNLYWGTAKQNGADRTRNHIFKGIGLTGYIKTANRKQRVLLRAYIAKRRIEIYQRTLQNQILPRREFAREMKLIGMTYAQIGAEMGISRQRVYQLVDPIRCATRSVTQPVAAA